jgi:flagellar biosynthesis/type III secretory pathway protein FliH
MRASPAASSQNGEVRNMKARKMSWAEQIFTEGFEKGLQEGLEIVRQRAVEEQVVRQYLLRQLGNRFGPLADKVKQQVEEIHSLERLYQLIDQILFASSLEEMGLQ